MTITHKCTIPTVHRFHHWDEQL